MGSGLCISLHTTSLNPDLYRDHCTFAVLRVLARQEASRAVGFSCPSGQAGVSILQRSPSDLTQKSKRFQKSVSCLLKITGIRTILYTALAFFILMAGVVWFVPVKFTACSPDSWWCTIAYRLTSSGGPAGFLLLLLVTGICYAATAPTAKEKAAVFLKSVISLAVFFGILAFINEHYTKYILKAQRPSHVYMLSQTGLSRTIDSLYQLDTPARQNFFAELIKNNPLKFNQIDPRIQHHWIDESGFSFPSGHTFNAFLFAIILAYAIYFNRSRPGWRNLFFIPFAWAAAVGISRVAMGAHTAFDVTAGAALGIVTGSLFLYIDLTRHWLTRKN